MRILRGVAGPRATTLHASSRVSERVFILKPGRSRALWAWWICLHALLGSSIWLTAIPHYVNLVLLGVLGMHAYLRRPREAPVLIGGPGGRWALPGLRLYNLELSRRTRFARTWIFLHFAGVHGRYASVLLLADQLSARDWHRVQIAVREADWRSEASGPAARGTQKEPLGRH